MASERLPLKAWALVEDDALMAHDGRLPVFWYRSVARLMNNQWFEGTGEIVRVEVRTVRRRKKKVADGE